MEYQYQYSNSNMVNNQLKAFIRTYCDILIQIPIWSIINIYRERFQCLLIKIQIPIWSIINTLTINKHTAIAAFKFQYGQ